MQPLPSLRLESSRQSLRQQPRGERSAARSLSISEPLIEVKNHPLTRSGPYLLLIGLALSVATPCHARVEQRKGECFERLLTSATITKQLGSCTIYTGTLGHQRVLWGFVLANGSRIDGWQDSQTSRTMVNRTPGFLYIPYKATSIDRLRPQQYFCLGNIGIATLTCGRLQSGGI